MKPLLLLATAALAVIASAFAAWADSQIVVASGMTVASSFASGTDKHVYVATIPAGAKVSLAVKSAKKGPRLTAKFADPAAKSLGEKSGAAPSFKGLVAATSGIYALTVKSADGTSTGGYSLVVSWKTPTRAAKTVAVDPDSSGSVTFSADHGATATISLKKAKRSAAVPALASIEAPDGLSTALPADPSATLNLTGTGDFVVRFGAGAAGGGVKVAVAIKPRKAPRLAFPLASVAGGAQVAILSAIGPPGGALELVEGPLAGASVTVPAGAVALPTTFLMGSGFTVAGGQPGTAAGPTIYVGPEGLTFPADKAVTVKIPFDPAVFGADASKLRVYTRDATGAVTLVPNPVVDLVNHFVTFPAAHFSAFQVLSEFHFTETQRLQTAPGTTTKQLGASLALSGDVAAAARYYAGNFTTEVAVFHRTGATFTEEAILLPPGVQPLDRFGDTPFAVAASGDRVLVGAYGRTTTFGIHSGAGFVFHRDSGGIWSLEAELSLPTWQDNDTVGATVAFDGDTALLAAPGQSAVHVFVRDGTSGLWSLQQTLTPPAGSTSFGYQPALQGDTAVVIGYGTNAQWLHVFRRTAGVWIASGRIDAPQLGGSAGSFSWPKIDGTTIAVTVVSSSIPVTEIRVYEDQGSAFPQVARLSISDAVGPGEAASGGFRSISVRGDMLLAGAPTFSPVLPGTAASVVQAGEAFLYRRVGGAWRFTTRLRGTPNDAFPLASADGFGSSVLVDGTTALVAAPQVQTADGRIGALYVFDLSGN